MNSEAFYSKRRVSRETFLAESSLFCLGIPTVLCTFITFLFNHSYVLYSLNLCLILNHEWLSTMGSSIILVSSGELGTVPSARICSINTFLWELKTSDLRKCARRSGKGEGENSGVR